MCARWLIGIVVAGSAAFASHGEPPADKPKASATEHAVDAKKLPDELEALNTASRKMYAGARARELTVIPTEYHALKSIAHTTLALFGHLSEEPGRPLNEERLKSLKEFQALVAATGPAVEKLGFDADTLARQKRLLARVEALAAKVLEDGKVSAEDLAKFCHAARADVVANGVAAVRAQLRATHKQVMEWKKDMTAEEWAALTVIVPGVQTARSENAAVQYFARLFGESSGEGRRVVYAESLWDEDKALNLLGTLRLDGKLSEAVFGDRFRMYRDLLADGARAAIDDILAPE
jgi:hypothetical protein